MNSQLIYSANNIYDSGFNPQPPVQQQPQQPINDPNMGRDDGPSSRKVIIIGVAVAVLVLIVVSVAVVLASGSGKKKAEEKTSDTSAAILQPAKALEVEQTNTAITQDFSTLDDDKQFPAAALDDKTLGL